MASSQAKEKSSGEKMKDGLKDLYSGSNAVMIPFQKPAVRVGYSTMVTELEFKKRYEHSIKNETLQTKASLQEDYRITAELRSKGTGKNKRASQDDIANAEKLYGKIPTNSFINNPKYVTDTEHPNKLYFKEEGKERRECVGLDKLHAVALEFHANDYSTAKGDNVDLFNKQMSKKFYYHQGAVRVLLFESDDHAASLLTSSVSNGLQGLASSTIAHQQHAPPAVQEEESSHAIVSNANQDHVNPDFVASLAFQYLKGQESGKATVLLTTGDFPEELLTYVEEYVYEFYLKKQQYTCEWMLDGEDVVLDPQKLLDKGGSIFVEYVNSKKKHVVLTSAMIHQIENETDDVFKEIREYFDFPHCLFEPEEWENLKSSANKACNRFLSRVIDNMVVKSERLEAENAWLRSFHSWC